MAVAKLVSGKHHLPVVVGVAARVVLQVAQRIRSIRAVGIVQMHGVDGRNGTAIHEGIFETFGPIVGQVALLIRPIEAKPSCEPLLWAQIHVGTTCESFKIGAYNVAVLFEIAHREIVIALLVGGIGAKAVLLTCASAYGCIVPVEVAGISRQDLRIGHQLSVSVEQGIVGLIKDVEV